MPFRQAERYLYLTTPLGEDALLLHGFTGKEAISQLFRFDLDLFADNSTSVPFDQLMGQGVSFGVRGESGAERDLHGIVVEFTQGWSDKDTTNFHMTIAPTVWKLTRTVRSRIFQRITIPDLLQKLFAGYDASYEFQGHYEPREYVVQYHESDFDFASRLMEEEGIYYFFRFTEGHHEMVFGDLPTSHKPLVGGSTVRFEPVQGGTRAGEERISSWSKTQYWGSGKYTVWDHHFQIPHPHLDADKVAVGAVPVGTESHKLNIAGNESLELYEYPGRYAQRFDGIDRGGGEKSGDLNKIYQDNKRTAAIRMQQLETPMLLIHGAGNHRQLTSGFRFTLEGHRDGNGDYVLLSVMHNASEGGFRSGDEAELHYGNTFTCIPYALPFRPPRMTPRPIIAGPQSAIVVGPAGEEIFTDKYGRVKVQFHWDREGKNDIDSSCWLRVTTSWAGTNWGSIHIPRIGQEVIVGFLEGDPDRPIITGSVYNAHEMPPYALPDKKTVSTLKSRSTLNGSPQNYNELRFEDRKGSEQVFFQAEKDMDVRVKNESREIIGANRHLDVGASQFETVAKDKHSNIGANFTITTAQNRAETVGQNSVESIGADHEMTVGANETTTIGAANALTVGASQSEAIGADKSVTVGANYQESCGQNYALAAGQDIHLKAGMNVVIEAGMQLTIKAGGSFISLGPSGVSIMGTMVMINSGGAPGVGKGSNPDKAKKPDKEVQKAKNPDKSDTGPDWGKSG